MRLAALLIPLVLAASVAAAADGWRVDPRADLRVRQEILDGVYHFAPDPDRNWIRVRTRAGATFGRGDHDLDVRLVNEHRHHLDPDLEFDWDELIVDRLAWTWAAPDGVRLTVGRQDIIWPGGFLMLEGHPLDGSRSIYHNAIRARVHDGYGGWDLALIRNPRRDDSVPAGDEDRQLTNFQETGFAGRWSRGDGALALIWKHEDIDRDDREEDTYTLSIGYEPPPGSGRRAYGEVAVQRRNLDFDPGIESTHVVGGGWNRLTYGWAVAGHLAAVRHPAPGHEVEVGAFYYSGDGKRMNAFRTPWGSWPKWSELYIYTLIGESEPDRVHVAAWENIGAGRVQWRFPVGRLGGKPLGMRLASLFLVASNPDWNGRGVLTQAELDYDFASGWKTHLLWEMLDPGAFHDEVPALPKLDHTVNFLRWQITCAFR